MSEGAEELPEEDEEEISFRNGTELTTEHSHQRQFLADLDTCKLLKSSQQELNNFPFFSHKLARIQTLARPHQLPCRE